MTDIDLPFSQACENNKLPIFEILSLYIQQGELLEIGHGTGQHAEYLSEKLQIKWHPCDQAQNNWMMQERLKTLNSQYISAPCEFVATDYEIKTTINQEFDYILSANTLHIMSELNMKVLLNNIHTFLKANGFLFFYGPFKFSGEFTSPSNENFDQYLKSNNELSGIRDFEIIKSTLEDHGISFEKRHDLPANNQLLVFKKTT